MTEAHMLLSLSAATAEPMSSNYWGPWALEPVLHN